MTSLDAVPLDCEDVERARLSLLREPAETHLRATDEGFRSIETHWHQAGHEAQRLRTEYGDEWASGVLRRWARELARIGSQGDSCTARFPHLEGA